MLKKPLFVSIFLLLFIGLSDYGYGCHKENMTHGKDPEQCPPPPEPEPPGDEGEYDVTIHMVSPVGGGLEGASNTATPWGEGNRRLIGQNSVNAPDRVGELTDLTFFVERFNGLALGTGSNCFGDPADPNKYGNVRLRESMVRRGPGGRAESNLRFFAFTEELENEYMPLYQLNLFGETVLSEEWFPSDAGTEMIMTDWKLQLEAEGQNVKNISCLGESEEGDGFQVKIVVTRTNEE